ncbi:MAG: hypothetical protein DHS20C09_16270 [marine bacterium B5-7]|nr:MAG: hypothetical protein DHS20C09_16270 [marine bacterium B5-7]
MDINELQKLITHGESNTVEFKRSTATLKSASETLCAFLNCHGGHVLIGVNNDGQIVGQTIADKTKLDISNTLKKFEPSANIDTSYVSIGGELFVIILSAKPEPNSIPYTFQGRAHTREQADTHIMPQTKYQQLLLTRQTKPIL